MYKDAKKLLTEIYKKTYRIRKDSIPLTDFYFSDEIEAKLGCKISNCTKEISEKKNKELNTYRKTLTERVTEKRQSIICDIRFLVDLNFLDKYKCQDGTYRLTPSGRDYVENINVRWCREFFPIITTFASLFIAGLAIVYKSK